MVTDTYEYDVFGAVSAHSGSSASPWKFTGEQHEGAAGDTGYYYLRARYYDVDLGRFISRDRVDLSQRYAYGFNNPIMMIDADGNLGVPRLTCDACGRATRSIPRGAQRGAAGVQAFARSDLAHGVMLALDTYAVGANIVADATLIAAPVVGVGSCLTGACGAGYATLLGVSAGARASANVASWGATALSCAAEFDGGCGRSLGASAVGQIVPRKIPLVGTYLDLAVLMADSGVHPAESNPRPAGVTVERPYE